MTLRRRKNDTPFRHSLTRIAAPSGRPCLLFKKHLFFTCFVLIHRLLFTFAECYYIRTFRYNEIHNYKQ